MIPNDQEIIKFWYAGLNDAYRATRGNLGTAGLHDLPRHRMIYYVVVGITMGVMSLCCMLITILFAFKIPFLAILCAVVSIAILPTAVSLFQAARFLSQAIASDANTDLADPIRMKVMKRGVRWGQKKGFVRQNQEGAWCFTDTKPQQ